MKLTELVGHTLAQVSFSMEQAKIKFLRSPLNPLACGYTIKNHYLFDRKPSSATGESPSGKWIKDKGLYQVDRYDSSIHGSPIYFVDEGEVVPGEKNLNDGKRPIHRHGGKWNSGPYKFDYE